MDDREFITCFEAGTIPRPAWDHQAHIRVAWIYLSGHGFEGALGKIREGIQKLNAVHLTPESLERGYHETVTRAWLTLVDATMRHHGACATSVDFCERHPHLLVPTLLRLFYTRGRIVSEAAKRGFVSPDLASLPA